MNARVVSIQTGRVKTHPPAEPGGKTWRSAIEKLPVLDPVYAGAEGLDGDAQADRRYHGGPDRALLAYCADHYPAWRALVGGSLDFGAFGENLTIEGLDESTACIGDELSLGPAVFQVSQPRIPCVKLARRLGLADAVERAYSSARTGFYLRVLREGLIEPGPLELRARPFPGLTVARTLRALSDAGQDPEGTNALIACPALSEGIRQALKRSARRAS